MTGDPREESARSRLTRARRDVVSTRVSSAAARRRAAPEPPAANAAASLRASLHARLLDELAERNLLHADDEAIRTAARELIERARAEGDLPVNHEEERDLVRSLTEEAIGLGPLAPFVSDPAVTDILVNGPRKVWVERFGRLEPVHAPFQDEAHLLRIIERIAGRVGRRIDAASPMVDLRLPDGSRVHATLPPVTPDGPTLSIRRFGARRLEAADLVKTGSFSPTMSDALEAFVLGRRNILISGGTGAGKSTLLGVLAAHIPASERVITIEDTLELQLDHPHWVRMESRPANVEGRGELTARDLVRNSLRMRPDRVIVGEVRGAEALDMLQAMNTGHEGSLGTIHANSPRDALARLETMVLMAGMDLPSRAIREQMVSAIDLIVHVSRDEDGVRRVGSICEVVGLEGTVPQLQDLFVFRRSGHREGRVLGRHTASGIVPRFGDEIRRRGIALPNEWFQPSEVSS